MPALFLLRHGIAETGQDDPPLSEEGALRMETAGRGMAHLGLRFDAILCSPMKRAVQTARIVAGATGFGGDPQVTEVLAAGLDASALSEVIERARGGSDGFEAVLAVGHAPDLGRLAGTLTGAASPISLSRGTLCRVDVPRWPLGERAVLALLLPSPVLEALGSRG